MPELGKNGNEIPQNDTRIDSKKPIYVNYVVSEGSTVVFHLVDFINDKEIEVDNFRFQSHRQKDSNNLVKIHENSQYLWFEAPYIKGNEINTKLHFEITIVDNYDSFTQEAVVVVKRVHRAVIFQGGVSLGAYEAGVFSALVQKLSKEDERKKENSENEKRPLFDIVCGTSIGAMNSAIIVSNIANGKSWKETAQEVIRFWKSQESATLADNLDTNPVYHNWWDIVHSTSKVFKQSTSESIEFYSKMNIPFDKIYGDVIRNWFLINPNFWKDYFLNGWYVPATAEAARRHYSAKQFHTYGAPNVASGIPPWGTFGKFFEWSDQSNYMPRTDNKHLPGFSLKKTIEKFASFPIKTSREKHEPRLLLVTVDVKTGDAVTFDSYSKKIKYHKDENFISYEKGVEIDHILASGTFPGFFDYPKFQVEHKDIKDYKEDHIFWDGGLRSNTPLRELIQAHRDYWHKTVNDPNDERNEREKEDDVPDLEVYIADLWPSELKEEPISFDSDFVENRKWSILFNDKTDYDEQIANFVTDYIDLAKQLKNLAQRKGARPDEINYILNMDGYSKNTKGETRAYNELLEGRFRLTKVVRIDHKDDGHEVGNKIYDYSYKTIEKLIKDGYCDTLRKMGILSVKNAFLKLRNNFAILNDKNEVKNDNIVFKKLEQLEKELQQIQQSIKIENSHDAPTLVNQVTEFIRTVSSLPDEVKESQMLVKKHKAYVIDAAKQYQEMISKQMLDLQLQSDF